LLIFDSLKIIIQEISAKTCNVSHSIILLSCLISPSISLAPNFCFEFRFNFVLIQRLLIVTYSKQLTHCWQNSAETVALYH